MDAILKRKMDHQDHSDFSTIPDEIDEEGNEKNT